MPTDQNAVALRPHPLGPRGLRQFAKRLRSGCARIVRQYRCACSPARLTRGLRSLDIRPGDTIMVQSAFSGFQYFKGSPIDAIRCIVSAVQPGGTVVMPAFPFNCTSFEYLERNPTFDVNQSPARTGLLCEIFRRNFAPIRSLHPTHSVLALGPRAEEIVSDHHRSRTPFDEHSPWHRIYELDGWDVNVGLTLKRLAITHCHYFEEQLESKLDLPLYWPDTFTAKVRDVDGQESTVRARAHHPASRDARNYPRLSQRFLDEGALRHVCVGTIDVWAGRVRTLYEVVQDLVDRGMPAFHEAMRPEVIRTTSSGSS